MLSLTRFLTPHRRAIVLVLALALAQSLGNLWLPRLTSDIVDRGIVRGDTRAILEVGGLMLLMSLIATLCAIAGSYYSAKVATGFGRILRGAIFTRSERAGALPPAVLESLWGQVGGSGGEVVANPAEAVTAAMRRAGPDGAVLVTGSIYLLAELTRRSVLLRPARAAR